MATILDMFRKYVGSGPVDVRTLREVVRRECRIAELGIVRVSPALLTELRADRAFVGRYCNAAERSVPRKIVVAKS